MFRRGWFSILYYTLFGVRWCVFNTRLDGRKTSLGTCCLLMAYGYERVVHLLRVFLYSSLWKIQKYFFGGEE
jgi:hypothetical protein